MTRYTPQWLQQGTYAASVDRRLIAFAFPGGAVAGCKVTVASGMTVNIAAGQVAVPTQNNTGSTLCSSDAVEQVTLTAAPGAGTNRYDVIVCQPRGNDLDGGANNDFVFAVVTGTAAASPTVPAVPAGQYALAQIYVPGGSASVSAANILDRRNLRDRDVYARAHLSTNAAIASSALVPFNVATRDPLGMYSISNKNFTVPCPGHYLVTGALDFLSNAVNQWGNITIRKNGAPIAFAGSNQWQLSGWDAPTAYSDIIVCTASGDVIDILYSGSYPTLGGAADGSRTYCTIQYLHP